MKLKQNMKLKTNIKAGELNKGANGKLRVGSGIVDEEVGG